MDIKAIMRLTSSFTVCVKGAETRGTRKAARSLK